jgi:hypothetical protein
VTNRDLYLFVAAIETQRSLEDYLRALWRLAEPHRALAALPPEMFTELLTDALEAEPRAYDAALPTGNAGYASFEATIASQIVDLHEMAANGQLDNEYRYFGISAPRGGSWYNFDPRGYLECAVAGTFAGWEEGDDTGRGYVPGLVAATDADGNIAMVDPRSIEDPVGALSPITWDAFAEFLFTGQIYE